VLAWLLHNDAPDQINAGRSEDCCIQVFCCSSSAHSGTTTEGCPPPKTFSRNQDSSSACPLSEDGGYWTGERKGETGEHRLFAFLTTESNDVVRPVHAKAMPVLLTASAENLRTI
jgi:hypothetical protein